MSYCKSTASAGARHQRGFTLVELMVAVTIGLVIIAALAGVLAASSGQSQTNDRTSELNTSGRFALNLLKQEIRQAGYRGYTQADPTVSGSIGLPTSPAGNVCFETGSSYEAFIGNLRQGIWGTNGSNPFAGNCIPAARYLAGTDVLVLRRVGGAPLATLKDDKVYFHSSYATGQMFIGDTPPNFGTVTPLGDFDVHVNVYYISPYSVSSTESPLVPSLRRLSLDDNGLMQDEMVVSGVEQMQVQFGRLTTAPANRYTDASAIIGGSADSPSNNPNYQWDEVNAVQVWLLVRNATPEPGYLNNQTYTLGSNSVTRSDNYRREVFTSVIQLRNFPTP